MNQDDEEEAGRAREPLVPPNDGDANDARLTVMAKAIIGTLVPMGGLAIELLQHLMNEPSEEKRREFLQALCRRVNDLQSDTRDLQEGLQRLRTDVDEDEGAYIEFGAGGSGDFGDSYNVSSYTDMGYGKGMISFGRDLRSDKIIVSPVSESQSVTVRHVTKGAVLFEYDELALREGKIKLSFRPLRR